MDAAAAAVAQRDELHDPVARDAHRQRPESSAALSRRCGRRGLRRGGGFGRAGFRIDAGSRLRIACAPSSLGLQLLGSAAPRSRGASGTSARRLREATAVRLALPQACRGLLGDRRRSAGRARRRRLRRRRGGAGLVSAASVGSPARSSRTPRPTSTPHRKMTTDTAVVTMNRNTSCFPLS